MLNRISYNACCPCLGVGWRRNRRGTLFCKHKFATGIQNLTTGSERRMIEVSLVFGTGTLLLTRLSVQRRGPSGRLKTYLRKIATGTDLRHWHRYSEMHVRLSDKVRLRHYCTVCPADLSSGAIRQVVPERFGMRLGHSRYTSESAGARRGLQISQCCLPPHKRC